jgi:hypothetical protein
MCRGRRARILLHLHTQLEGTVLRGSRVPQCIRQPRPSVYPKEGTYHTRLFRGPRTYDMKK